MSGYTVPAMSDIVFGRGRIAAHAGLAQTLPPDIPQGYARDFLAGWYLEKNKPTVAAELAHHPRQLSRKPWLSTGRRKA